MAKRKKSITRITVEARALRNSERRGVAQYLYRLFAALLDLSDSEGYHVIVDREINPLNAIDHPRFIVRTVPACRGYRFNTWLQFRLPIHLLRTPYDLVFYSYNVLPLLHPNKSIVAIHDIKIQKSRGSFLLRHGSDVLLRIIAYNLGNLLRRLVLPVAMQSWSLTSLQQHLFKTGGRRIRHARYFTLQLLKVT